MQVYVCDGLSFDAFQEGVLNLKELLRNFQVRRLSDRAGQAQELIGEKAESENARTFPLSGKDVLAMLEIFYEWAGYQPTIRDSGLSSVVVIRTKSTKNSKNGQSLESIDEDEDDEAGSIQDTEIDILNSFYAKDIERAITAAKAGEINNALTRYLTRRDWEYDESRAEGAYVEDDVTEHASRHLFNTVALTPEVILVPSPIPDPPKPIFRPPDPPKGLAKFFGKKKHQLATDQAREIYGQNLAEWQAKLKMMPMRRQEALDAHAQAESDRVAALDTARAEYAEKCASREAEVVERNKRLDILIANLGYGIAEAVQEYISIVLSNSVYPEGFEITHEFEFEPSTAELRLHAFVPSPDKIPEIKAYKYTKSTDEITASPLAQKVCRDRYASAVHQIALRSLHEVFEADRRGLIRTISLEVGTHAVDPATGQPSYIPFVVVGAERDSFLTFNLSAVIPAQTLERLGAAVSKNPYSLVAVETTGVRRS